MGEKKGVIFLSVANEDIVGHYHQNSQPVEVAIAKKSRIIVAISFYSWFRLDILQLLLFFVFGHLLPSRKIFMEQNIYIISSSYRLHVSVYLEKK